MGYQRFDGNSEDVMRVFLREKSVPTNEIRDDYPHQVKSLLSKRMLERCERKKCSFRDRSGGTLRITERGKSAITQQLRNDEYWVSPLRTRAFKVRR